jgi:hypothetical protein
MKPTDADHLRRVLAIAEMSFVLRDKRDFERAVHDLVTHPDVDGWRPGVETFMHEQIRDAVRAAWRLGWQPADVVRVASKRFSGITVALGRDAVADELSVYDPNTVDPRWFSQLEAVDARVWWPRDRTYLRARIEKPRALWSTVMASSLELLCLVVTLRRLERLGPVPGEFRRVASRGGDVGARAAEVGEKVLARIRAMLAKAEATTSEAEAAAFTAAAHERMARYSIDIAMVEANDPGGGSSRPQGRRIGIDSPYESPKAMLLDAVAKANRCSSIWSRDLGFATVIGFEVDVIATETLFTSLLLQATTALEWSDMLVSNPKRARSRAFRHSFLVAYASRIQERLTLITAAQTQAASAGSAGDRLLPVLASRNQAVESLVAELFPHLKRQASVSYSDPAGWNSGLGAADQANLHGPEVSGRRS